jgi:hypothetical protein
MGEYKTEKIVSLNTPGFTSIHGNWRSRPKNGRLFNEDEIRLIRVQEGSLRHLAEIHGCSQVLIRNIKKRCIYEDVI